MLGPIETLLNVRTSSQQLRDSFELEIAQSYLKNDKKVDLEPVRFLFGSNSPVPLSWHLTPEQKKEIGKSWLDNENVKAKNRVYDVLGCLATGP